MKHRLRVVAVGIAALGVSAGIAAPAWAIDDPDASHFVPTGNGVLHIVSTPSGQFHENNLVHPGPCRSFISDAGQVPNPNCTVPR